MESGSLDRLRKRLYEKSPDFSVRAKRGSLSGQDEDTVPIDWKDEDNKTAKTHPFITMKTAFIASILFLVVSFGLAYLLWTSGGNIVSNRNIDIEIKAPSNVESGKVVNVNVIVKNSNNAMLELADLSFEFGSGVFNKDGKELSRLRFSLGEISPGKTVEQSLNLVFLGVEGEKKNIRATLEYRVADSNAIFAKKQDVMLVVSRAPVGVTLNLPDSANSGDEVEVTINVISNSDSILNDLIVKADYPPGFIFKGASPDPSNSINVWNLGDVATLEERSITLRGTIEGEDFTERAFRVHVGAESGDSFLTYGNGSASVIIKKPSLDLTLRINGRDAREASVSRGGSVRGEIVWSNRLLTPLHNIKISMKLRGVAFDERSISVSNGFYRPGDKTLTWDASSLATLGEVGPGDNGSVRFSFDIFDQFPSGKNFSVVLDVNASGESFVPGSGTERISNRVAKELKIGSPLQSSARGLYYAGAFTNTGPLPPKVGDETTYTIVWSLGNNTNDFSDVRVKAFLPPYVRWMNSVAAGSAGSISYNAETGDVIWDLGVLNAGAGISHPTTEVSFQIGFAPTPNQVGKSPVLVSDQMLEARDSFLDKSLVGSFNDITTNLAGDAQVTHSMSIVQE